MKNDAYIDRIRQKRSEPIVLKNHFSMKQNDRLAVFFFVWQIFREKLEWITKAPKIDSHNDELLEVIKDRKKPTVSQQWYN